MKTIGSRIILILMLISVNSLSAQTKWSGSFTLKVSIKGSLDDSIGLFYYDVIARKQVSVRKKLQQGVSTFEGNISEPIIATLYIGSNYIRGNISSDSSVRIYLQSGKIDITGDNSLKNALVKGSSITDSFALSESELSPFRNQMTELTSTVTKYKENGDSLREFIAIKKLDSLNSIFRLKVMPAIVIKYRNSPVGAYQLNNLLYNYYRGEMDTSVIIPLFNQLSLDVQQVSTAKFLEDRIKRVRKANQMTGSLAPDFVRTDINGKQVHLSDFRGKYVLIDFWGSWCTPCRKSHPHLKELYAKYKDQGLEIIGVAQEMVGDLPAMQKKWKQAVADDGLTWTQVLNTDGKKDFDIVQGYGVEAFPTKILLDKEGHIIDRIVGDNESIIDTKLHGLLTQ